MYRGMIYPTVIITPFHGGATRLQIQHSLTVGAFYMEVSMDRMPHECRHPGCHALTRDKYCAAHAPLHAQHEPVGYPRKSASQRGYNSRWDKARKTYLAQHPLCMCDECRRSGHPLMADVVDHIVPHHGDQKLFWDTSNWQALNHVCHNKKTAREDGGFGNRRHAPGG